MTAELIGTILGLVGLSNIITFFLTKKKYNGEVDSQQIKNMSDSFDLYKNMQQETFKSQNEKIDMLQKENNELRQQVSQLQMQMINILGSICLDATCKMRKMNFQSDVRINDSGIHIGESKN